MPKGNQKNGENAAEPRPRYASKIKQDRSNDRKAKEQILVLQVDIGKVKKFLLFALFAKNKIYIMKDMHLPLQN